MTNIKRPMLAAPVDEEFIYSPKMKWPQILQPKLDGIRCVVHPEMGPVTRKLKHVPNHHVREVLRAEVRQACLDGEIVTYDGSEISAHTLKDFNGIQSDVMSREGTPEFRFIVFDCFKHPNDPYDDRFDLAALFAQSMHHCVMVPSSIVETPDDYMDRAEDYISLGWEGICSRTMDSPYKENRSTANQGWLLKYKPIADAEGKICGFEELHKNTNDLTQDELGYAKRSHEKDGMVPMGILGALILETEWGELRVGTGFDAAQRQDFWERQTDLLGQTVTFKYQKHGMKDLPRFPVFKGVRHD